MIGQVAIVLATLIGAASVAVVGCVCYEDWLEKQVAR